MNLRKGFRRLIFVLSVFLFISFVFINYLIMRTPEEKIKWSEIKIDTKFKNLNEWQQLGIKQKYWDDVISKDMDYVFLDKNERETVKKRFFEVEAMPDEQAQKELMRYQAANELEKRERISIPNFPFFVKKHGMISSILISFLGGIVIFVATWFFYFIIEWIMRGFFEKVTK